MKTLIIIPTYNEKGNAAFLARSVFGMGLENMELLFVDDNSPDGTAGEISGLRSGDSRVHLLERRMRMGLGSAYLAGFAWAIEKGYDAVVQMDADLSHDPAYLPALLDGLMDHDLVIGSRYISGGGIENWGVLRLMLSRLGNIYARRVLGNPVKDLTGGYNAWRSHIVKELLASSIESDGYLFQIEIKDRTVRSGHTFIELPIIFRERRRGKSKMNGRIIWEAVWRVWRIKKNIARTKKQP